MSYFKENQTVYCAIWGKGTVIEIDYNKEFPIFVSFENNRREEYSFDGRWIITGNITLSQNPIPPIINVFEITYNLSFGEAIQKAMESEQITCELWKDHTIYLTFIHSILMVIEKDDVLTKYEVKDYEINAKWGIVE